MKYIVKEAFYDANSFLLYPEGSTIEIEEEARAKAGLKRGLIEKIEEKQEKPAAKKKAAAKKK